MECSKGWKERCATSKGKKCTCACGGGNHGKGHQHNTGKQSGTGLSGDVFKFKGMGVHDSKCGVRIVVEGQKATVFLTELDDNPGTSVTNAVEDIATLLYKESNLLVGIPPEAITWIEHYPQRGTISETYDRVLLSWYPTVSHWQSGKVIGIGSFANPRWIPMKKEDVAA
jgi:hypothetical protein